MSEGICRKCLHNAYCNQHYTEAVVVGCSRFEYKQPITNADRIRAMTDEELAEFIVMHDNCPADRNRDDYDCESSDGCDKCWLAWLKQEANHD